MGADQKALNALAKGAGVAAFGLFFSKALTYFYRILIARGVGPNAYGQLSIALMIVGIGTTISYLSVGSALKKYIPEFRSRNEPGKIKGLLISSIEISLPLTLLVAFSILLGSEVIAGFFGIEKLAPLLKIMSISVITINITSLFFDTTIGFNKIAYKTLTTEILQSIIQIVVTGILLLAGFGVMSAAWGWLAGSAISALIGILVVEKKIGPILLSNQKKVPQHKEIIRFSAPLLFSGLLATLMGWADTGILGYYMTDYQVGLYNAALPTAMLILIPHQAIGSLAISSFSELKERNSESLEDSIQKATGWVLTLVIPTFLLLLLYSEEVLRLLFGQTYTTAYLALSILAVGYLVDASVGMVGNLLKSLGNTKYLLYNNSAALLLNLILNLALIPHIGIIGAAIATASSTALANILMFIEVWREKKIISIPQQKTIKIILTAITPLITLAILDKILFTTTPFWFLIPAGILYYTTYFLLYLKTIGVQSEEKEIIKIIGEKTGRKELANRAIDKLEIYENN